MDPEQISTPYPIVSTYRVSTGAWGNQERKPGEHQISIHCRILIATPVSVRNIPSEEGRGFPEQNAFAGPRAPFRTPPGRPRGQDNHAYAITVNEYSCSKQ